MAHCELKLALNLQYSISIMWVRFRIACCLRTELDEQHPLSIDRILVQNFGFKLQIEIRIKWHFAIKMDEFKFSSERTLVASSCFLAVLFLAG